MPQSLLLTDKRLLIRFIAVCSVLLLGVALPCDSEAQLTPDPLSILYNSINAQQANFPLPSTDATVTVGTIHVGGMGLKRGPTGLPLPETYIEYSVPTYKDGTLVPSPPCAPGHGNEPLTPRLVAGDGVKGFIVPQGAAPEFACPPRQQNYGAAVSVANIKNLSLRFAIDRWPTSFPGPMSVTVTLGSAPPKVVQAAPRRSCSP